MTNELTTKISSALDNHSDVAKEICQLHGEVLGCVKIGLEKAIRIGELLAQEKEKQGHGRFLNWIKTNLPFTDRTARNYLHLYQGRDQLKTEIISNLTAGYKLLAKGDTAQKFERPLALFQELITKCLLMNRFVDTPADCEKYFNDARSLCLVFFNTLETYLSDLEKEGDTTRLLTEYAWVSRACQKLQNLFAEYTICCERKMGQILNQMEKDSPEVFEFLKANDFRLEAIEWVIDTGRNRVEELEAANRKG